VTFVLYRDGEECDGSAAFDLGFAYRVLAVHRSAPGKYSVVLDAPMSPPEVQLFDEGRRGPRRRRGVDPTNHRITRTIQLDARAAIAELGRRSCVEGFTSPTIEIGVRPTLAELRRSLSRR